MTDYTQFIVPQRGGMSVTMDFDEATGQVTEPIVGFGSDPNSPFNGEIPEDYISPDAFNPDESGDVDDDIADAVSELYGDHLEGIKDFMVATLPASQVEAYDAAIDSGDWSMVLPLLEQVAEEYFQALEQGIKFEPPSEDQSDEDIAAELNQIEPEGYETAMNILGHAEKAEGAERALLMAAAEFHAGRITAEDAYQQLRQEYSNEELEKYWNKWNQ